MAWFDGFERQTLTVAGMPVCFRRSVDWAAQAQLPVRRSLQGLRGEPRTARRCSADRARRRARAQ